MCTLNTSACLLTSAGVTNEVSEPAGKRQGTSPDWHSQGHMWKTKKGVSSAQLRTASILSINSVCGCWDHWETTGSQLSPVLTVQIVLIFSYSPELFSLIFHFKIQKTVSWKHSLCNVDYFSPFLLKAHLLWLSLLISSCGLLQFQNFRRLCVKIVEKCVPFVSLYACRESNVMLYRTP